MKCRYKRQKKLIEMEESKPITLGPVSRCSTKVNQKHGFEFRADVKIINGPTTGNFPLILTEQ